MASLPSPAHSSPPPGTRHVSPATSSAPGHSPAPRNHGRGRRVPKLGVRPSATLPCGCAAATWGRRAAGRGRLLRPWPEFLAQPRVLGGCQDRPVLQGARCPARTPAGAGPFAGPRASVKAQPPDTPARPAPRGRGWRRAPIPPGSAAGLVRSLRSFVSHSLLPCRTLETSARSRGCTSHQTSRVTRTWPLTSEAPPTTRRRPRRPPARRRSSAPPARPLGQGVQV